MAATQADLDRLERAIALGAREVQMVGGVRVSYHSLTEMLRARDLLRKELGLTPGGIQMVPTEYRSGLQ